MAAYMRIQGPVRLYARNVLGESTEIRYGATLKGNGFLLIPVLGERVAVIPPYVAAVPRMMKGEYR